MLGKLLADANGTNRGGALVRTQSGDIHGLRYIIPQSIDFVC